jgi:uncharacterized protein YdiU (UPF0061 family)
MNNNQAKYDKMVKLLDDLDKAAAEARDAFPHLSWENSLAENVLQRTAQLKDALQFHRVAEMSMHPKGPNPKELERSKAIMESKAFKKHYPMQYERRDD